MTLTSSGRDFFLYTLALNASTDTSFQITTGYTPATPPSGYVSGQIMNASSILIRCRSAVDMYLRKTASSTEYFTIPSGTTFEFKLNPNNTQNLFFLRSASSTPTAEILVYVE